MKYNKIVVILNSKSSGGKAKIKFDVFKDKFKIISGESDVEFYYSNTIDEMSLYVEKICNNKLKDLIVAYGGDGTISSISNALMKVDFDKRIPILPVPAGTGNSFLVDLGISTVDDAFNKFDKDGHFLSDIMEVKTKERLFYCINIVGMGFISDLAEFSVRYKKVLGGFAYVLAVFTALGRFRPYKTKITFSDNKVFQSDRVFFLTVSNNKFTASKFMVAPQADISDGIGDVIILHDLNRFQFLKGFAKIFSGNHINDKGCTYIKSSSLKIESEPNFFIMPDGDLLTDYSPVEVNVLKSQIKFAIKK